jgi:cytochrome c biogenesis protein CcdA/thiol-disulfide isomerase/thioredoxin
MTLLVISFIAGVLTVLAPCILPVLPVIIGSSATGRSKATPYIVVASLAASIIVFTYLLKASTAFIMIPPQFWTYLSGGILVLFGLTLLFPALWERIPGLGKLSVGSNKLVGTGIKKKSFWGDVLIGAALGPVFSTCSPTYFVILASVLPASFALGTLYLLAYVAGLSLVLLLLALLGEGLASKLSGFADPKGWFKRGLGVLFLIVGIFVASGADKDLQIAILDSGFFDITKIEQGLLENLEESEMPAEADTASAGEGNSSIFTLPNVGSVSPKPGGTPYKEITGAAGYVNVDSITIGELVGKKVILVDFMTYSCINCQRTFPYVNAWYRKYKDEGLEIVGIHTPEFAFEKDIGNVREAMAEFGIIHPVVLDNDYATWGAYGNRYWPRKYLIDIYGNIVYDHIGEGAYEETEKKIQELLAERAEVLGEGDMGTTALAASEIPEANNQAGSPETYFGAWRNTNFGSGVSGVTGTKTYADPSIPKINTLYLPGTWNITKEYAESVADSRVKFVYSAKNVFFVAGAPSPVEMEVRIDGASVPESKAGADIFYKNGKSYVTIQKNQLYKIIEGTARETHTLEFVIPSASLQAFTFTFG